MLLADLVYNVPANVILDSARRALTGYDVITSMIKAWAFSTAISVVGWSGLVQIGANWQGAACHQLLRRCSGSSGLCAPLDFLHSS